MTKFKHFFFVASLLMLSLAGASCSADELIAPETGDNKTPHTCTLVFEGEIDKFDQATSASRSAGWAENDTLFIIFEGSAGKIEGKAIYSATTGTWNLNYFGDLLDVADGNCNVYHFKNIAGIDAAGLKASFSAGTAIYGDTISTYSKTGLVVKVKAHLKPFTGRLRFKGEPGTKFTLHGVERFTSYTSANGLLTSAYEAEELLVGSSGYTPYVYGKVTSDKRRIWAAYDDESYMLVCSNTVLAAGKSGFMNAPTEQSYAGWRRSLDKPFTVNGVTFLMKYVQGGTFSMGATPEQSEYADNDEYPVHEVTLSDYYMAETETTQELWKAVMGTSPSSNKIGKNLPVEQVSWTSCSNFAGSLAKLTSAAFSMPTEAQWEFAARGGVASGGYIYSGSNIQDEVAWYSSNNSRSKTHTVATKLPNELGLYDMSGNVKEWCQDWYGSYTNAVATDPTGPTSGSYRVIRGGHNFDNADNCRVAYRNNSAPSSAAYYLGFRLALNLSNTGE